MKRIFLLTICAAAFLGSQFLLNCSSPLDTSGGLVPNPPGPNPTETVFVFDTVFVADSVSDTIIDTLLDTVLVTDTVVLVDTIVVIQPDSSCTLLLCSQISPCHHKIVWLLGNLSGNYQLEFLASTQSHFKERIIFLIIDGQRYEWDVVNESELQIERHLTEDAVIEAFPAAPPAYGHAVDICLKLTRK